MIKKKKVTKHKNTEIRKTKPKRSSPKLNLMKPKFKDILAPVETVTMIQSPKAVEVDVKLFPILKSKIIKKVNELFNPRNRMTHQTR